MATEAEGRPLVVRMSYTGTTSLHAELQDTRSLLREELRAIASEIDVNLWIEKMSLDTTETVTISAHTPAVDESDAQDLFAMLDQASSDPELLEVLASDFSAFLPTTPASGSGDESLSASVRQGKWDLLSHNQRPPYARGYSGPGTNAL